MAGQGDTDSSGSSLELEVRRLGRAVEELERRLARIEAGPAPLAPASPPPADDRAAPSDGAAPSEAAHGSHIHFTRLAVACFALGGALVLRLATQRGWLPDHAGYALGVGYATLLFVIPGLAAALGRRWVHSRALELCGGVLTPLVLLEATCARVVGVPTATLALGAVCLAAGALGVLQRSAAEVGTILLAQLAAAACLGFPLEGIVWRGTLLVGITALAYCCAARCGWSFLRPLILVPSLLLLGLGVIATAQNPEAPPGVALRLLLDVIGVLLVVAVNTASRIAVLDRFERGGALLTVLCAYALSLLHAAGVARLAAPALALLLAVLAPLRAARPIASGLLVTSALLALLSLPWVDPTGLALVCLALLLQRAAAALEQPALAAQVLSQLLALCAVVVASVSGDLWERAPGGLPLRPLAGAALGGLLFLHFHVSLRPRVSAIARQLAAASLAGALLAFYAAVRLVAWYALPASQILALVQSGALALLSLSVLAWGRRRSLSPAVSLGVLGIVLLAAKVLIWDLRRLEGACLLVGVLMLGATALLASLAFRARKKSTVS